jgi:hypothetical protein
MVIGMLHSYPAWKMTLSRVGVELNGIEREKEHKKQLVP